MKDRVTLTLDREILKKIDQQIDGRGIRNRSHAVELILDRYLKSQRVKTAVLLCGGRGTRLRPITYEIPKALIPVQGKTITEHIFDLLKRHEIRNVIMSVGHLKEKIKEYFGDGFKFGMNITYVEEDEPLGTAGPLRLIKEMGFLPTETFIVSNGDELKDINIDEMFRSHRKSRALATLALTTVDDPSAYGVASLSGNRILEFVEKPKKKDAPSKLINAGFYMLEPGVVDIIPKGQSSIEKDIFPKLAAGSGLHGFPFSGQWFDTGSIERYEKALKNWRPIGFINSANK